MYIYIYKLNLQLRPSVALPAMTVYTENTTPLKSTESRNSSATHWNALERTGTHWNALQHTATHCNKLQHTATYCNTMQRTATHCDILQHTATHCNTLQHTATHCNTLQHTATHCIHRIEKLKFLGISRYKSKLTIGPIWINTKESQFSLSLI